MTNPMRGQVEIELGKDVYKARLTIDSIIQIEQAVGCGILKLTSRMGEGDIALGDIVQVLLPALRGGGNDIQMRDVHRIVSKIGIVEATRTVAGLLTSALLTEEEIDEEDVEKKLDEEAEVSATSPTGD